MMLPSAIATDIGNKVYCVDFNDCHYNLLKYFPVKRAWQLTTKGDESKIGVPINSCEFHERVLRSYEIKFFDPKDIQ